MKKLMFDIETARAYNKLSDAPESFVSAWTKFSIRKYPEMEVNTAFEENAGLYPEYGKVICITSFASSSQELYSIANDDEQHMLLLFKKYLESLGTVTLCGHRIKYFDIPFINIRCVANGIALFPAMKQHGLKPWEQRILDTWEIWKGGMFQTSQASSLNDLCLVLGVDTPKDAIDGSHVSDYYYRGLIKEIVAYCERDVIANTKCFQKMRKLNMI